MPKIQFYDFHDFMPSGSPANQADTNQIRRIPVENCYSIKFRFKKQI